ncbi:hypothetical protein D6C80_09367 [Aureobasidium pullulans]|nr:hypothetical protein D6C80_09367 [Aureobasidium pullulans]
MSDFCRTCALRTQRSAVSALRRNTQTRSFTASTSAQKNNGMHLRHTIAPSPTDNISTAALPTFAETSSPELDDVLLQLRTKHFIPAYLNKRQRHLIFGDKFKQELENNPAYATLGEEEIPLKHIDRRSEIPARKPLVLQALRLIEENDEWRQLPSLLEGLHKARPTPDLVLQERILRKLQLNDQFPVILRSLRRSNATGLTLKNDAVLNQVLNALRETASLENWEQTRLERSLKHASELAELLESTDHGSGRKLSPNDARTRPAVIGLFLELHAVYASQYQGGKDVDGKVKAYATRFMATFNESNQVCFFLCLNINAHTFSNKSQPAETDLPEVGAPIEFLSKMSIYHGLSLASKILGGEMPDAPRANQIVQQYEQRLSTLAAALSARNPEPHSFAASSLRAWDACVR